jgi:predicted nucleic acid-binding protein
VVTLRALSGKRVYVDTNVVIYSAEGFAEHTAILKAFFEAMESKAFTGVTSEVTLMEALVRPIRDANARLVDYYETLLGPNSSLEVSPVTQSVLRQAASMRATSNAKPIDAIHVATALTSHCDLFVSDDRDLKAEPIQKMSLRELSDA